MKRIIPLLLLTALAGCAALRPPALTADSAPAGWSPHASLRFGATFSSWQFVNCAPNTPCTANGPINSHTGDPAYLSFYKLNTDITQLSQMFGASSHLATSGTVNSSDIVGLWSGCSSGTPLLSYTGSCSAGGSSSGTVSDGSGTTTANEVALSTSTAHVIGYAPNLTYSSAGNVTIGAPSSGPSLVLHGNGAQSTLAIDSTSYPWSLNGTLDFGPLGGLESDGSSTNLALNLYYGSNWTYKTALPGVIAREDNTGAWLIQTAPSGTAGSAATLTTRFTVANDGGVTVGSPTGGDKGAGTLNATGVYVNGAAALTANQTITLSGDASGSGSTSIPVTVSKVNGASLPASQGLLGTNSSSQIIAAPASGVTAGSYTSADITVNAQGQVTAASNGTASASSITPGTTTVVGATAPCLLDNSTGTTMGCPATLPTSAEPAHTGDMTNTAGSLATTVVKVNGGSIPASAGCVSTNSSSQFTSGCPQDINPQTGTTYTIASTDAGKLVTFSNASAVAVTLPVATTAGFTAGFAFTVQNLGVGLVTITPTTSTINAATSLTIPTNMGCAIVSDGTNYQVGACGALQAQVSAQTAGISVTPPCSVRTVTVTSTAYTIAAPTNGALTQTAGGTLGATTYYVESTWVTASGQTVGATETSLAVSASNVLNVAAPASPPANATGWDVYVSTATGTETLQASGIGTTTAWVEPTTGLVSGAALPSSNTSGQFTVNTPAGCTPYDGQKLVLFVQSASGGTLTYSATGYKTGATTGAWPSTSGAASDDDHFVLIYDGYAPTPGWALDGYNLGIP